MYKEIEKDGQQVIQLDGVELPVYQIDPDYEPANRSGCLNCSWHTLTDEQKQEIADAVEAIAKKV